MTGPNDFNVVAENIEDMPKSSPRDGRVTALPTDKWRGTVDLISRVSNVPNALIVECTDEGYHLAAVSGGKSFGYARHGFIHRDENIFCRKVVEDQCSLHVKNAAEDDTWHDNPVFLKGGFSSYYGLPLKWPDGRLFGTVCLLDVDEIPCAPGFAETMESFKTLIEGDLDLVIRRDEALALSMTDELTGLLNRRGFGFAAERSVRIAQRLNESCAFFCIDINGLKWINDNLGHHVGDKAIRSVAHVLADSTRDSDVVARMGGDEFVILALVKEAGETDILLNRVRSGLERLSFGLKIKRPLSVSAGHVVVRSRDVDDIDRLLKVADERMYDEKHCFHAKMARASQS